MMITYPLKNKWSIMSPRFVYPPMTNAGYYILNVFFVYCPKIIFFPFLSFLGALLNYHLAEVFLKIRIFREKIKLQKCLWAEKLQLLFSQCRCLLEFFVDLIDIVFSLLARVEAEEIGQRLLTICQIVNFKHPVLLFRVLFLLDSNCAR